VFRYDQLFVLKETNAPAVLVEAGIIVNRNDELVLASPERRALITAAMVAAAQEFCGMQQRKLPSKTSASSPRPKQ
jgi:N-acetylmuramoyl-L-alanine amidase